jgi:ABC-type multidrug transport system ATPase subunit/pSer/pThr/pTyr-binding forkhead associated (FHA) protein
MRCRVCKTENQIDALYCEKCGAKLSFAVENDSAEVIVTFGRANDNKIIINNAKVSSHHGQFRIINGQINIEDLGSSNGTYINGKKVIISNLKYGDTLKIGADINFDWNLLNPYLRNQQSGTLQQNASKVVMDKTDKSTITIGRTADNDIVIKNIKVSRNHARVIKFGNEWQIEDLNSSNGTFVNGKKIQDALFTRYDNITIGGVPLDIHSLFIDNEQREITGNVSITAKNVTYNVSNKTIVDDITLPVKPGEFVGLIGPSGAGKTTLMMMMAGVVKPSHGDIYINDLSLFSNYNSFKGQIGYVPQDDIIHRELKVEESFQFTARLRLEHTSQTDISQQVDAVIKTLDLTDSKDTLIGSVEKKGISGGQRKRVNMGQELITEPSILFLDEPTSGLDPKTDLDVMYLLKSITNKGKIVILTTHNITIENFEILSHVIILTHGGKLAFFGPANKASGYFNVNKPYKIFY